MEIVKQKRIGLYIEPEEFKNPETFMMRWGLAAHTDLKHLLQFLKAPGHLGNIYVRRHYQSSVSKFLVSSSHQTMRNTSIANQFYEFGHTYVGIGFVDLFQLAWGSYKDSLSGQNLTFYGYDSSCLLYTSPSPRDRG